MAQPIKTDAQIQHDVLDELKWDTRVKETDVGVEVNDGIVTLTGTVDSWTARTAPHSWPPLRLLPLFAVNEPQRVLKVPRNGG